MNTQELLNTLIGKTLIKADNSGNSIKLEFDDTTICRLYHEQDCCESVIVEDVVGFELEELVGGILVRFEESIGVPPEDWEPGEWNDSFTWTFYRLDTTKGSSVIRFYGESNGYYSESVTVEVVDSGQLKQKSTTW